MKTFAQLLEMKIDLAGVPLMDVSKGPVSFIANTPYILTGREILEGLARAKKIQMQLQEAIDACETKLLEAQQS